MVNTDTYITMKLDEFQKRLVREKKELKGFPAGKLRTQNCRGTTQYLQVVKEITETGRVYYRLTAITKDIHLVHKLARKKTLEISIDLLSKEIKNIEKYLKSHVDSSYTNVMALIPQSMNQLPNKAFFPQKKAHQDWAAVNYLKNTYKEENKIHVTSRGERMRSKSEVFIAEKLYEHDVPFRYDAMICFEGQWQLNFHSAYANFHIKIMLHFPAIAILA